MTYATRTDIDNVYGSANVTQWADINNTGDPTEIDARVAWALAEADDRIDNRMREGPYAIPFDPVPRTITNIAARLAGYYLYESRGLIDPDNAAQNQVKPSRDYAERQLDDALSNRIRLDATRTADTTYPTIPTET